MRRRPAFLALALLLYPLFFPLVANSQDTPLSPDEARQTLTECDALFESRRDEPPVTEELVERYELVAQCLPGDYEAHWKLARAYWWAAESASDSDEMARLGRLAYETGIEAAALAADKPEGHYYAAAGVGEWSEGIGIVRALWEGLEDKFLTELRAAEKLSPDIFHGGPDRIWCRYYYRLPWPKRDLEKSEAHCRAALEKGPRSIRAHFYFADTLKARDRDEPAHAMLSKCLTMKPEEDYDPIDGALNQRLCRARAKEWGF
ncbi:MAG: hypothetical protein KDH09_01595 [Chrysiogenetes bacterium]|nr:hypothetical protein [Chrysiogenetes bacterium]